MRSSKTLSRLVVWLFGYLGRLLTRLGACIAAAATLGMVGLIGLDVTGRYLFNKPTYVCQEVSGYLLVVITFMGAAYTLREGGHVSIDVVRRVLSPRVAQVMTIATSIMSIGFVAIIIWQTSLLPLQSIKFKSVSPTSLSLPMFIPQGVVPLGLIVLAIELISYTVGLIKPSQNEKSRFNIDRRPRHEVLDEKTEI